MYTLFPNLGVFIFFENCNKHVWFLAIFKNVFVYLPLNDYDNKQKDLNLPWTNRVAWVPISFRLHRDNAMVDNALAIDDDG